MAQHTRRYCGHCVRRCRQDHQREAGERVDVGGASGWRGRLLQWQRGRGCGHVYGYGCVHGGWSRRAVLLAHKAGFGFGLGMWSPRRIDDDLDLVIRIILLGLVHYAPSFSAWVGCRGLNKATFALSTWRHPRNTGERL
jgi:hypothetical protein